MNLEDVSAWLGKPPPVASKMQQIEQSAPSDVESEPISNVLSGSVQEDAGETHGDQRSSHDAATVDEGLKEVSERVQSSTIAPDSARIEVLVPSLSDEAKAGYNFLGGHFVLKQIMHENEGGGYLAELQSGEIEKISPDQLDGFENGIQALADFLDKDSQRARRTTITAKHQVALDWTEIDFSSSDSDVQLISHAHKRRETQAERSSSNSITSASDDDTGSDHMLSAGRRSSRLASSKRKNYVTNFVELNDSDDASLRQTRQSTRTRTRTRTGAKNGTSSPGADAYATRRSERTRILPRRSMREKHEDEISSTSERETGPKIVGTKEYFSRIPEIDPFRRRHRQECDTCAYAGDDAHKGPLVFCQGCTNAYHKVCLGSRSSRDHLVTKAGDALFLLQCRRCIGVAFDKDVLAPHHGMCSTCDQPGDASKRFRDRLTTKQEQLQREENGGADIITSVDPALMNNPVNVMFRCATCQRAWHMHHLPDRKVQTTVDGGEDEELPDQAQIAQKRFELYHRSWVCKDCIENQQMIDALIAWRPTQAEAYSPGTTGDKILESQKEYLIKWRGQSHLRLTWMPGAWVWGVATNSMRIAFMRKDENALPKMTIKDAVPEDVFRIDIVFDVRYTSVVRNSSKEIDLVRAKEVDTAYVKYKGLGFEDAIWEKPPTYSETERWEDFKTAYEDYVKKVYLAIPSQSTLRRHLTTVRNQDFNVVARQSQPSNMTGGELMQYQLEGLNWLYWQWHRLHNAILADEMGLGKTIQLIAFLATLTQEHKCWPFLVIVPNATCPNWKREIRKWAPLLRAVTYYGSERARKLTHDFELFPKDREKDKDEPESATKKRSEVKDIKAHIVIASYESIIEEKTRKSLLRVPWQGLIVDEGQRLKNDKNLIYESLSRFNFPFKVLLTGTPLQNNARELFNLVQFLDKSIKASDLEAQYAELTEENVPELRDKLRPFFLRRTKAQVLTFLPPMAQIIIPVTMSTVQKRVYKSILSQNPHLMKAIFSREVSLSQKDRVNLNNILIQLRRTLCHPFVYNREIEERTNDQEAAHRGLVDASAKLQLLQIMLPKLQERGHRVLMFTQWLANLDIMEDFLDGLGMLHRRLDGNINAIEKQKRIDEFNAPDSPYFAFLLSTRAGGVGINLATADTVIILDPDFNPHQDIQALSRAHRIGQMNKVLVFQLMTKGTAEEKIMAIGKKKMALDHILIERMGQPDDAGEDLESILKFGAEAIFDDQDSESQIVYDSVSVDKLLDRSSIESTKISDDKSAESQFSFARVWENDKSALEDGMTDMGENKASNPDIWDKILQEREQAYAEEISRKAEALGRGKRKRGQVDYRTKTVEGGKVNVDEDDDSSDYSSLAGSENKGRQYSSSSDDGEDEEKATPPPRTIRARPFKRVKVPTGIAPHFNGDGPADYIPMGGLPPYHRCTACHEDHHLGWCRLKIAGVEHCGLCGQAHIGHARTCPHLRDEGQVDILLATLKESTESRELVEEAQKYLKLIRSHLVSERRAQEKKMAETLQNHHRFQETNAHLQRTLGGRSTQPAWLNREFDDNRGFGVQHNYNHHAGTQSPQVQYDHNHAHRQGQPHAQTQSQYQPRHADHPMSYSNGGQGANTGEDYDLLLRNSMLNLQRAIGGAVSQAANSSNRDNFRRHNHGGYP